MAVVIEAAFFLACRLERVQELTDGIQRKAEDDGLDEKEISEKRQIILKYCFGLELKTLLLGMVVKCLLPPIQVHTKEQKVQRAIST